MAIITADADLTRDRELLIETLGRLLTPLFGEQRFDWLYKSNPDGVARTWLAIDTQAERIVGTAAAFRRRFYFGDGEVSAWVLGDFCLDAPYRSLGPALQLQRACLGVMESHGGMFCYDFPSASMVAVYKRLGFEVTGKMLRLAKLLRVDRKVREILNVPMAQHAVSAVGNTVLKLIPARIVPDANVEFSFHRGPCGEEFSILANKQRGQDTCIQRSAEYLNWRYVSNPLANYEFMTARRHRALIGYVVWTQAGEDAVVVDLFGEEDPAMVKGLLAKTAAHLAKRGVMTLSVWLNESHPWFSAYSEMGFQVRDSAPFVCVPAASFAKTFDVLSAEWFLMHGDRDC